jgi:hypothetical protein
MSTVKDDRSLGELLGDLARESGLLVRQEIALARSELSEKAQAVGKDLGYLAMGGLVAYAGFLAIVAAIIIGLAAAGLAWWLSALIVGLVVAGVGYLLVKKGLTALRNEDLGPRHTVESLQEDAQWAKEQVQ